MTIHESNYHSTKLEFLALKWVIAEQFQEYLLWKPFVVRTNNNLLTYIMTTPNVDATQHHWVELLVRFTFSIKYQKGRDTAAAYAMSCVALKLDTVTMKSILDGVTVGMTKRVDAHHLAVVDADKEIYNQVQETVILARAAQVHVDLHVTNWVATKQEDLILKTVIKWVSNQKVHDLKHLMGKDADTEDRKPILIECKKLVLYQGALYHHHMSAGKLEKVLQFVVPKAHWVAAMNGWTLCLLHDQFW